MMAPQHFSAMLCRQFVEGRSCPGAVEDNALVGAVIDNFPRFREVIAGAERFAENTLKATTAPQVATEDRRES